MKYVSIEMHRRKFGYQNNAHFHVFPLTDYTCRPFQRNKDISLLSYRP
jgi:hypothetical protein